MLEGKPVLSPAMLAELARDNPLGITITPDEVEAWWNYVAWPRFKTYEYRQHGRAIRKWWARVRMDEIEHARASMGRARVEHLERLQERLNAPPAENDQTAEERRGAMRAIFGGKG